MQVNAKLEEKEKALQNVSYFWIIICSNNSILKILLVFIFLNIHGGGYF